LLHAPFVVVRRAPIQNGNIPIGIRGKSRGERFAAFLPKEAVAECLTPEQLAEQKGLKQSPRRFSMKALLALDFVDELFKSYDISWGPVGSVGFELASDVPTVTEMSDLDIVVRVPYFFPVETAKKLVDELNKAPVRIDTQLETPNGAISLNEYARGDQFLLFRTMEGPRLVKNQCIKGNFSGLNIVK
jgi:phosphoribosyl-dephospho-CoA transferase